MDSITSQLKQKGYNIEGAKIWYFSRLYDAFTFCGIEPVPRTMFIAKEEYEQDKVVGVQAELSPPDQDDEDEEEDKKVSAEEAEAKEDKKEDEGGKNGMQRVKERKLSVIVKKVKKWRDLYFGYINQEGKRVRLSLEEAAVKVRLPKKTLDDYLQQLKIGKSCGFDFNQYKQDKIGKLRDFVKKNKEPKPRTKRVNPDGSTLTAGEPKRKRKSAAGKKALSDAAQPKTLGEAKSDEAKTEEKVMVKSEPRIVLEDTPAANAVKANSGS